MSEFDDTKIHGQNIIACVWDFDKTLIPGYMQGPIFEEFGVDARRFWREVQRLPEIYASRGIRISDDTSYLNHLLTYVRMGPLRGLSNKILRRLGAKLTFCPGLPDFFHTLKAIPHSRQEFRKHDITLEHYIISNGIAEMIRGSEIAPLVENIYGCEFVENPMPPGFEQQGELRITTDGEISQIGLIVDNTIKTRFIFEINKGSNKNPDISVNALMRHEDRRIPLRNMLYIADGPSDVPVFSVIKRSGGRTYAVHDPSSDEEFQQNDNLLQQGRVHGFGPADYTQQSATHRWLKLHVTKLCERIAHERETLLASRVNQPPRHIHKRDDETNIEPAPRQDEFFA